MPEYQYKNVAGEVNIVDDKAGIVDAFVSTTGIVDHGKDNILPGAYAKTLRERVPKVCWAHAWEHPIGKCLKAVELLPGNKMLTPSHQTLKAGALWTRSQLNLKVQAGRDALEWLKFWTEENPEDPQFKTRAEWSIGYDCSGTNDKGEQKAYRDKQSGVRFIKALDLFEYSPVAHGMAPLTDTLSIKDLPRPMRVIVQAAKAMQDGMLSPLAELSLDELAGAVDLKDYSRFRKDLGDDQSDNQPSDDTEAVHKNAARIETEPEPDNHSKHTAKAGGDATTKPTEDSYDDGSPQKPADPKWEDDDSDDGKGGGGREDVDAKSRHSVRTWVTMFGGKDWASWDQEHPESAAGEEEPPEEQPKPSSGAPKPSSGAPKPSSGAPKSPAGGTADAVADASPKPSEGEGDKKPEGESEIAKIGEAIHHVVETGVDVVREGRERGDRWSEQWSASSSSNQKDWAQWNAEHQGAGRATGNKPGGGPVRGTGAGGQITGADLQEHVGHQMSFQVPGEADHSGTLKGTEFDDSGHEHAVIEGDKGTEKLPLSWISGASRRDNKTIRTIEFGSHEETRKAATDLTSVTHQDELDEEREEEHTEEGGHETPPIEKAFAGWKLGRKEQERDERGRFAGGGGSEASDREYDSHLDAIRQQDERYKNDPEFRRQVDATYERDLRLSGADQADTRSHDERLEDDPDAHINERFQARAAQRSGANAKPSVGQRIRGVFSHKPQKTNKPNIPLPKDSDGYVEDNDGEAGDASRRVDAPQDAALPVELSKRGIPDEDGRQDASPMKTRFQSKRDFDANVGGGVDRDKLAASDFVLPKTRSFPIVTAGDVQDAVDSWGRHVAANPGASFDDFKARLTSIAKRKGFPLPASWKNGEKTVSDHVSTKAWVNLEGSYEDTIADLSEAVDRMVDSVFPDLDVCAWVEGTFPGKAIIGVAHNGDPGDTQVEYWQLPYSINNDDVVTLSAPSSVDVQGVAVDRPGDFAAGTNFLPATAVAAKGLQRKNATRQWRRYSLLYNLYGIDPEVGHPGLTPAVLRLAPEGLSNIPDAGSSDFRTGQMDMSQPGGAEPNIPDNSPVTANDHYDSGNMTAPPLPSWYQGTYTVDNVGNLTPAPLSAQALTGSGAKPGPVDPSLYTGSHYGDQPAPKLDGILGTTLDAGTMNYRGMVPGEAKNETRILRHRRLLDLFNARMPNGDEPLSDSTDTDIKGILTTISEAFTETKEGRMLSAANAGHLSDAHEAMGAMLNAHAKLAQAHSAMGDLLRQAGVEPSVYEPQNEEGGKDEEGVPIEPVEAKSFMADLAEWRSLQDEETP